MSRARTEMQFKNRLYGEPDDLAQMRRFLIDAARECGFGPYMHAGDLVWRMYQNTIFEPTQNILLFFEDEALVGFAWFYPPHTVEFQVHPRYRGTGLLEAPMLDWAQSRLREQPHDAHEHVRLISNAVDDAYALQEFLRAHGFERVDKYTLLLEKRLDAPLDFEPVESGVTLHHIANERQFAERVELHREVWYPSKVTLEAYRRMRTIPGYDPELDLVAETREGVFASYCICWYDEVNHTGEFEPVGTRAAYRRRGLGRAILQEGFRRLQALGARSAIVACYENNRAFYESVGFREIHRDYEWVKNINSITVTASGRVNDRSGNL
jgi:ribosomal protein S18 acetylase RimI-like enzyme